jgi:transposase
VPASPLRRDPVPEETARVAKAAFPKGTVYMTMRDQLGTVFEDEDFAHLFPSRGQPATAPWRLALVTIMQFAEGLSDRQAANAVRGTIDCKYALSLELDDPGFDASVLSQFRTRLLEGGSEGLLFDHTLDRLREMGLVKARGKQRTDSTRILAVVRGLNRPELVGETMRHALDVLSTVAPQWLQGRVRPEWVERYVRRLDDHRLPKSEEARQAEGEKIGADGQELVDAIYSEDAPSWLRELPAVETPRKVWMQNYFREQDGSAKWRTSEIGIPPSTKFVGPPFDTEARYATRPDYKWQARESTGFEAAAFTIDWDNEVATCPEGKQSLSWTPAIDRQNTKVMKIKFSGKDCMPRPSRDLRIRSVKDYKRRTISIRRPREHHEALQRARKREGTAEFKAQYTRRAGIEGTVSRAVRTCEVRRSRYIGLTKTHLHHLPSATSLSFLRVGEWLMGVPKATTRRSPFARLMAEPVAA